MVIKKKFHEYTLGGDHEFTMSRKANNRLVKLVDYLPQDGPLGRDENSSNLIAEIRSNPSICPLEVTKNTKLIMEQAITDNPDLLDFNWYAKSAIGGVVCGSHIHLGHSKKIVPIEHVIEVMDQLIGSISLLLEDRKQALKRRRYNETPAGNVVHYGDKGNYRVICHDSLDRYEYRTPSTFLSSMEIFRAFMCLSKVVVGQVLNNKSFRFNKYVNGDDFIDVNVNKIRKLFPHIWNDISGMYLFNEYKKYLEIIPYLVNHKLTSYPTDKCDIKSAWNLNLKPFEQIKK